MKQDVCFAFGLGIVVIIGAVLYGGPSSGDDTFIYMRYVENHLRHAGFVYNPGESSHGVTSSLWTLLMAPISRLFGNTIGVWKMSSAICAGLAAALLFLAIRRDQVRLGWALGLTVMVSAEPHNFRWYYSGMENGLVVLILALTALLLQVCKHSQTQPPVMWSCLGLALGIMPHCRPELAVFSGGLFLYLLLAFRQGSSKYILGATYILTLLLASTGVWLAFHSLIPQTAEAKAFLLTHPNPWYGLRKTVQIIISGSIGCVGIMVSTKTSHKVPQGWRVVTLGALVIFVGYLSIVNQIVASRYASYLNVPTMIAAALLVADTCFRGQPLKLWTKTLLSGQFIVAIVVLGAVFPVTRISEDAEIKKVADFVASHTAPDARIAISEIGALGFYSDRYIIDIFGLTDRATLRWKHAHGVPQNIAQFEAFLLARDATHYIATNDQRAALAGERLRFSLMGQFVVKRNIFSQGQYLSDTWKVYSLRPR